MSTQNITKRAYEHDVAIWRSVAQHRPGSTKLADKALRVKPASRPLALRLLKQYTAARELAAPSQNRYKRWIAREALALATAAGYHTDEHGTYKRGDHLTVSGLDFVPPYLSNDRPFLDHGGKGLALIEVFRRRVYARSSAWCPSTASQRFIVGRNEAETYFSHPVSAKCATVPEALNWMWHNHAGDLIQRQGDIALVTGAGPKMPRLPAGHTVAGSQIVHATHEPLPLPQAGQRIIVARRASTRFISATRD